MPADCKRLVETAGNPAPLGATLHELKTADGLALRAAVWRPAGAAVGTILVCTGRTEFIEKYFEFIGEIVGRGYAAVCFDWRGQGLSQRQLEERTAGHVVRFADYELDLDAVVALMTLENLPQPWIVFGHSMGGHVALRQMARRPGQFERAVLSAPMLKVWMPWYLRTIVTGLAGFMCLIGRGAVFVPGGKDNDGLDLKFEDNRVTTDPVRYARNNDILRADPDLALAGPTWNWVREGFRSMRLLRRASFARRIGCPLMIVGAAHDRIVNQGPDMTLIRRVKRGLYVLFSDAEHELVQERDHIRLVFWQAVEAFLEGHV